MSAWKRLLAAFRGSDSGQSLVEYLIIVGACALVGIAGFTRYGKSVNSDLTGDAKHIEGEGLPNTEGILSVIGADYNEVPGWCVKPNYCFAAGTPVQTESGDRAIDTLRVGDRIWARDVRTGAIALREVVHTYRTLHVPVVDLVLSAGLGLKEHLSVTRNHLFWVENAGWVRADGLGAQSLWSTDAQLNAELLDLNRAPTTVYNLEVSEFHSYFVGHSHVLVHNGDPDGTGCPTGNSTGTTAEEPRSAAGTGPLQCGDSGSYKSDLGGGTASGTKQARESKNMERDHIPSGAALASRADRLLDQWIEQQMNEKCRMLTPTERDELEAKVAEMKKDKKLQEKFREAVEDPAFAIEVPTKFHYAGRTRGSKNYKGVEPLPGGLFDERGDAKVKQFNKDSEDLYLAAQEDIKRYEELLAGEYKGTDLDEQCRRRILAAIEAIRNKTDKQYEDELNQIAQAQFERLGFGSLLEEQCSAEPVASN